MIFSDEIYRELFDGFDRDTRDEGWMSVDELREKYQKRRDKINKDICKGKYTGKTTKYIFDKTGLSFPDIRSLMRKHGY